MKEGAKLSTFYLFRIALESIAYPSCPEIFIISVANAQLNGQG